MELERLPVQQGFQIVGREVLLNADPLSLRLSELSWEVAQLRNELKTMMEVQSQEVGMTTYYFGAGFSAFLALLGYLYFPGIIGILIILSAMGPLIMSLAGLRLGKRYSE